MLSRTEPYLPSAARLRVNALVVSPLIAAVAWDLVCLGVFPSLGFHSISGGVYFGGGGITGVLMVLVASRSWAGVSRPRLGRLSATAFLATAFWLLIAAAVLLVGSCAGDGYCATADS